MEPYPALSESGDSGLIFIALPDIYPTGETHGSLKAHLLKKMQKFLKETYVKKKLTYQL